MGSQSKINLAYIAGFLDGDGSLMLQIKKRKDGSSKLRFMPTICFYQDSRHKEPLSWIRESFGIGYLSDRNDGMTELRINGYKRVRDILKSLLPFIKFKKSQAEALCSAAAILAQKKLKEFTKSELLNLVELMILIQNCNYATKRKKTKEELMRILGLTP